MSLFPKHKHPLRLKREQDILRQLARDCKNCVVSGTFHFAQILVSLGREACEKSIYLNFPGEYINKPVGYLSRGYISMHVRPYTKPATPLWHEKGLIGLNFFWKRIAYQAVTQLKRLKAASKIKRWWIDMFWNPNTYLGKKRLQRSYDADEYSVW